MSATVETKKDVLKELEGQVSLLRRQVTAEKKVNDHIAGQVKQLGDNMELLRTFAEEDANTIAGLLDRQKSLEDGYQAMIVALEEIRDAVNVFASAEPAISPEEAQNERRHRCGADLPDRVALHRTDRCEQARRCEPCPDLLPTRLAW